MTQHKWHKEIHAWADGAEIEQYHSILGWIAFDGHRDHFFEANEYRIKPQPKEKKYLYAYYKNGLPIDISFVKWSSYPGYKYLGKIEVQND